MHLYFTLSPIFHYGVFIKKEQETHNTPNIINFIADLYMNNCICNFDQWWESSQQSSINVIQGGKSSFKRRFWFINLYLAGEQNHSVKYLSGMLNNVYIRRSSLFNDSIHCHCSACLLFFCTNCGSCTHFKKKKFMYF